MHHKIPFVDKPIDKGIGYFQVVIVILSVYSLIALAFSTFLNLSPELERLLNYIDLLVCLLFLVDFFMNFIQSENKLSFMKWGWIDLISSVSAPKNPTGKKYKIINFNPVYEKVKIYREPDYKGS